MKMSPIPPPPIKEESPPPPPPPPVASVSNLAPVPSVQLPYYNNIQPSSSTMHMPEFRPTGKLILIVSYVCALISPQSHLYCMYASCMSTFQSQNRENRIFR